LPRSFGNLESLQVLEVDDFETFALAEPESPSFAAIAGILESFVQGRPSVRVFSRLTLSSPLIVVDPSDHQAKVADSLIKQMHELVSRSLS